MEISLGLFAVFIFVLAPGLILRRLYFYGEFSQEYSSGLNISSLLISSIIPGLTICFVSYILYVQIFNNICFDTVIDKFKEISNSTPTTLPKINCKTNFDKLLIEDVFPFTAFHYIISIVFGLLSGRFIRITRLDTRFRMFRFKNYWFYVFNNKQDGFKKFKHLKEKNKKHLFTKADILIDSNNKTYLYSGYVIDYELKHDNCSELSKVYLQDAERYSIVNGASTKKKVPGDMLIVDCSSLKNINLRYIYEELQERKSNFPNVIELINSAIIILLIPIFLVRINAIDF